MKIQKIFKILALIAIRLIEPIRTQYSQCLNPQSLRGLCIPVQQCPFILNIALFNQQNFGAQTFLSRSRCGFDGYNTFVCCPQTTQSKPEATSSIQNQQMAKNVVKPTKAYLPKPPICGADVENRILGGSMTSIYEFPWFALLKYSKPGSVSPIFSCSGSLISDRYTVTASHCVDPKILQRTKLVGVRLGEWNVLTNPDCDDSYVNEKLCNDPYVDVGIEEVITHEQYLPQSFNQHNDIALIRMSQKVIFNDFIKPICLKADPSLSTVGSAVSVAGFGKTESAVSSNFKLKVSLNIVEIEKCNQLFRLERRLNENQICAGGQKNIDSCRGDSGGPMMKLVANDRSFYWVLLGIVSYGSNPCGQDNKPAVYTKVGSYIEWIESKLRM